MQNARGGEEDVMKDAQKFVLWGTTVLLLVNLVSIAASWCYFGYLDWKIVWEMALVLLPPLVVAVGSYFLLGIDAGTQKETKIAAKRPTGNYGVPYETPTH